MISVVAGTLFDDISEERFNVYFDSIGGISAKYHVIKEDVACVETSFRSRKIPFAMDGRPGNPISVTIGGETVNTKYTANRDICIVGSLKMDTYSGGDTVTHVCSF